MSQHPLSEAYQVSGRASMAEPSDGLQMRIAFHQQSNQVERGEDPSNSVEATDGGFRAPKAVRPAQRLGSASCLKTNRRVVDRQTTQEAVAMNREQMEEYFRRDIWYPITAEGICELCDNLRHVTAADRQWINEHIPPGVYKTPDDAISAATWGRN